MNPSIAVVTGAAQGIGRAAAVRFAAAGYDVAAFDLADASNEAEATLAAIRASGRRAEALAVDVADPTQVSAGFDECERRLGVASILINNAGIAIRKPALDLTPQDWNRVVGVDLSGAFFCAQRFARSAIGAGTGGAIVNVASIYGLTGGRNRAAYSAAKAGLVNLTRVLAQEWHEHGIRVNAVAPTFVRTPLTEGLLAGGLDVQNKSLGGRFASVEDVAEAIFFLSSPAAGMITGHTLPVDDGWLTW